MKKFLVAFICGALAFLGLGVLTATPAEAASTVIFSSSDYNPSSFKLYTKTSPSAPWKRLYTGQDRKLDRTNDRFKANRPFRLYYIGGRTKLIPANKEYVVGKTIAKNLPWVVALQD